MPTDILRRRLSGPGPRAQPVVPVNERFMVLSAGAVQLTVKLAATATAERIWAALPLFGVAEPWGASIHFQLPIATGRDRTARLQARLGDVCYWSEERRVIVPFGATPISRAGEIRMPSPVNVFGSAIGDVGVLQSVRVGEKVTLSRAHDVRA